MHWTLPPTVGGVETHIVDIASHLSAKGACVTIISGERNPDRSLFPEQVQLVYEPTLALAQDHTVDGLESRSFRILERELLDRDPHVIHAHNLFPLGPVRLSDSLERVRKLTGVKLVHTSYSEWEPA